MSYSVSQGSFEPLLVHFLTMLHIHSVVFCKNHLTAKPLLLWTGRSNKSAVKVRVFCLDSLNPESAVYKQNLLILICP